MKPEPIPTAPSMAVSYGLLIFVVLAFVATLVAFVNGGLMGALAEVGRLMLGIAKR